jgi:hypothetical protein
MVTGELEDVVLGQEYDGCQVKCHTESKSPIEAALEMDDCPKDTRINQDKVSKRDFEDKKKATERKKLLAEYVGRLDKRVNPHRDTESNPHRYTEYEHKLNRLKQRFMQQNEHVFANMGRRDDSDGAVRDLMAGILFTAEDSSVYSLGDLPKYVLMDISSEFYEVTEQDNVLGYLVSIEDLHESSCDSEIRRCKDMLLRLEGRTDPYGVERREEWEAKLKDLETTKKFSPIFKQILSEAREELRKAHGQEIEDGYNIIQKASDVVDGTFCLGGNQLSPVDIGSFYRDKLITCKDCSEAFSFIASIAEHGKMSVNQQAVAA